MQLNFEFIKVFLSILYFLQLFVKLKVLHLLIENLLESIEIYKF